MSNPGKSQFGSADPAPVALVALAALAAASLVLVVALERSAHATGFLSDQYGSDHGQPAIASPYSVYFNPAAMAGMQQNELVVEGLVAARSMSYDRSASALSPSSASNATYVSANVGQATLFNVLGAPYVGFVTDFGHSKLRFGIATYVPFGGQVHWDKNVAFGGITAAPGAYDGTQRWASISATTSSLYGTLALAYRFEGPRLGIGISASAIRTGVTDYRARNLDGSDDVFTQGGAMKEGRSWLDVSGWQAGAAAGVYWEPASDGSFRLGLSYTSQPGFGTMRLNGSLLLQSGTQEMEGGLSKVDFLQGYPDIIRAGAAWRIASAAELRLDASWQRWSQFKYQCVVPVGSSCNVDKNGASTSVIVNLPRDFHDAAKVRLGAAYWIRPETEVFGSFAYESSPVGSAHIDALVFDSTRLYGTLGLRHRFNESFAVQAGYTYVYFVPVTVSDSTLPNYSLPSKWPSANGRYSSELYLFDAALSYSF
jgi:long-chain fatty acid transport protein